MKPEAVYRSAIAEKTAGCADVAGLASELEAFLAEGVIVDEGPDGAFELSFIRVLVERIAGLKVEIRHREHPPPHFHVIAAGIDASYAIVSGERLRGSLSPANDRKIRFWLEAARPTLIEVWNQTRPSDCSVGPIAQSEGAD